MQKIRLYSMILALLAMSAVVRAAEDDAAWYAGVANVALGVISVHNPTLDEAYILMCPAARADSLAKDGDIGSFIRHMRAAGSDLAVIVIPPNMKVVGTTYVVYFKDNKPIGSLALASRPAPTDEVVAKAYVPFSGPAATLKRQPGYEFGEIQADDGTKIQTLKIAGWQ